MNVGNQYWKMGDSILRILFSTKRIFLTKRIIYRVGGEKKIKKGENLFYFFLFSENLESAGL